MKHLSWDFCTTHVCYAWYWCRYWYRPIPRAVVSVSEVSVNSGISTPLYTGEQEEVFWVHVVEGGTVVGS